MQLGNREFSKFSKMAAGRSSVWSCKMSLLLLLCTVLTVHSSDRSTSNSSNSLFIGLKLDNKIYPSRNCGLPRQSTMSEVPTSAKISSGIYLTKMSASAFFLILLANDVSINPGPVLVFLAHGMRQRRHQGAL